jgi:hypothetical protein
MTLAEHLMKDDMILLCYDFHKKDESGTENDLRAKLRTEITRKPYFAVMHTQSVYYLPATMQSLDTIKRWARNKHAEIVVFGNVELDIDVKRKMVNKYVARLRHILREVNEDAKARRRELLDFEEDIDSSDATLRGWASKPNKLKLRFEEIRHAINRVGKNEHATNAEFELDKLATYVEVNLIQRYERVRNMKKKMRGRK